MSKDSISTRLQSLFGITKHELAFASLLLSGLLIFAIAKYIGNINKETPDHEKIAEAIYKALDSLADINTTTYTGVNEKGEAITDLASGDTVVEKESFFPQSNKKELPKSLINLNTASKTELMHLPGVGEKTADNITSYRKEHRFTKPSDIMDIKGIGKKKFEKMRPYIEVK